MTGSSLKSKQQFSLADFLVTDKPFPSVFFHQLNTEAVCRSHFPKANFSVWRWFEFLKVFSLKKSVCIMIFMSPFTYKYTSFAFPAIPTISDQGCMYSALNGSGHHFHGQLRTYPQPASSQVNRGPILNISHEIFLCLWPIVVFWSNIL